MQKLKAISITEKLVSGQDYKYALFSDIHIDSPSCQLDLLKYHLDICKKENARIFINGDLFDAILLRDMKRATNSRMEAQDGQLNVKIEKTVDFLKPYIDNIAFIGRGNHEESVMKYNGVDVTAWLINELNHYKTNGVVAYGGYRSFIRIGFDYPNDKKVQHRIVYDILAHHGSGGAAPVTKGMIDFNRIANGAIVNLIWIGHKHNSLQDNSLPITRITQNGFIEVVNRKAIQTPAYTSQLHDPKNLNFEDRFYNLQAASGFGMLTLTPHRSKEEGLWLEEDLRIIDKTR